MRRSASGLPYYDWNVSPKSPTGFLYHDSPFKKTNPKYEPEFGAYAEIGLADVLSKEAKIRDFKVEVEDLPEYTRYTIDGLTDQDKIAVQKILDNFVHAFAAFQQKKQKIDITPRYTKLGTLFGPDVDSEESLRVLYWILPVTGQGSAIEELVVKYGRELQGKIKQTLQSIAAIQEILGPSQLDKGEYSKTPAYQVTIKLNQPSTAGIKNLICNKLKVWEEIEINSLELQPTGSVGFQTWLARLAENQNQIFDYKLRTAIRNSLRQANVLENFPVQARKLANLIVRF